MKTNLKILRAILESEDEIPDPVWDWLFDFEAELKADYALLEKNKHCSPYDLDREFNKGLREQIKKVLGDA